MEPKFQTSFIPKSPIVNNSSSFSDAPAGSVNILRTVVVLFFIVSIAASSGVFAFTYYLKSKIESLNVSLREAESVFNSPQNQNILLVSDQLKSIQTLLTEHKVISPLFQMLEQETLPTVRWSSFTFSRDMSGQVSVMIKGEAQSYASLAQQAEIFLNSDWLVEVVFNGVALSNEGTVETTMKVIINPDIIRYSNQIEKLSILSPIH